MIPPFNKETGYLDEDCYKSTLEEFKTQLVDIDNRKKRFELFKKYLAYNNRFKKIIKKVWIGGSYVTIKPKPNDIDLTVHFDALKFNDLKVMQFMERGHFKNYAYMKSKYKCHTMLVPVYPEDHPNYQITELQSKYWYKFFTRDRKKIPKGIVELVNKETK